MILGAGLGFKIALAGGGLAGGVVLVTGAAQGGAEETSLAMKPETMTALCSYAPSPDQASPAPATPSPAPRTGSAAASPSDSSSGQTLTSLGLDSTQRETARIIVQTGASDGMPKRAVVIAVATALQESDLGHDLVGDHGTSFGVFHQKTTSGYGTRDQIMHPHHAAHEFFARLQHIPDWQSLPLTQVAQAVQHSGFPDAYAKHETRAEKIVDDIPYGAPSQSPSDAPQADAADHTLTGEEKSTIESQVVVAAASGLSLHEATTKIVQAVTDARSHSQSPAGQPSTGPTTSDLQTRVAQHVREAAADLCAQLTADASNLPDRISGAARGVIAVQAAMKMLGTPYSWGGGGADGPSYGIAQGSNINGFDCSGLAQYAWAKAGVHLGRTTDDQWNNGRKVPRDQLQPGDLLFFASDPHDPATIHHVGINIDGQRMVQSPQTGGHVEVSHWTGNPYREAQFIGAVRPANQ